MSESYKRALVRNWCEAVVTAPYVPTINDNARPEPTMSTWFTVIWEPDTVEPIAYCGISAETGLLNVVVGGEPNLGDGVVAAANDSIVAELLARVDPESALTLERAQGTVEHSAGGADRWYRLNTPISYRYVAAAPSTAIRMTEFGIVRIVE